MPAKFSSCAIRTSSHPERWHRQLTLQVTPLLLIIDPFQLLSVLLLHPIYLFHFSFFFFAYVLAICRCIVLCSHSFGSMESRHPGSSVSRAVPPPPPHPHPTPAPPPRRSPPTPPPRPPPTVPTTPPRPPPTQTHGTPRKGSPLRLREARLDSMTVREQACLISHRLLLSHALAVVVF